VDTKCNAALFGASLGQIQQENRKMQNSIDESVNKKFSDINAELGVIKNNQITLQNTMTAVANITAELKLQLQAQVSAIVGIGNKVDNSITSVGGNQVINETGLMEKIFDKLAEIFGAVIALLLGLLKGYKADIKAKDKQIEYLEYSRKKYQSCVHRFMNPEFDKFLVEFEKREGQVD